MIMPSIASRTISVQQAVDQQHGPAPEQPLAPVPFSGQPSYVTSTAPSRGILPIEYSYQNSLYVLQPDSPYFQRSNINVTTAVRNTALTALTKTKFTKTKVGAPS